MATMTSSTSKPKTFFTTGLLTDIDCNYCKEKGLRESERKEKDVQEGKSTRKKTFLKSGTERKTNQTEER